MILERSSRARLKAKHAFNKRSHGPLNAKHVVKKGYIVSVLCSAASMIHTDV